MRPNSGKAWIEDIDAKANLILRDCSIDKIRYQTIGNLAKAYSIIGQRDKVFEIAQLLPDNAYSKTRLLGFAAPTEGNSRYKPDCILKFTRILSSDILAIASHHIFRGDAAIAVDICHRALTIIDCIGAEGVLLYNSICT